MYSAPITKRQAIEIYANVMRPGSNIEKFVEKIDAIQDYISFMKDFNRMMNLRLRVFAPEMYQIIYE